MNKQSLYLECCSGISGDMVVAALLDLGADQKALLAMLATIPISGFRVNIDTCRKCGIKARDFEVILTEEDQVCRQLADMEGIIEQTGTSRKVKDLAIAMLRIAAEAESQVHFHEASAVESLVEILSAAFCLVDLGLEEVIIPGLSEGRGWVRCQHGKLPVPEPAVLNIVSQYGIALNPTDVEGELITPTGAAIAAAAVTRDQLPAHYKIIRFGIGTGKKDFEHANILRALVIEEQLEPEGLWMLETNLDDCSAEALGYTAEMLMKAGARDVFFSPVFMKKGRPAYLLSVLTGQRQIAAMEELIFKHTTTIGIRRYEVARTALERSGETIITALGEIRVKCVKREEEITYIPEFESVRAVCEEFQIGYQKAWDEIKREIDKANKSV